MIIRYQMKFCAGIYRSIDPSWAGTNILCAAELRRWVHLPGRRPTIWLCISEAPKSLKYAYRFIICGVVQFISGDTAVEEIIRSRSPLATSTDVFWHRNMPRNGFAWIEYE